METSWYGDLIKWAISTKSPWTIIAAFVVALASAVVGVVFTHKARKLARQKADLLKKEEEQEQKRENLILTAGEELEAEKRKELEELDASLEALKNKIEETEKALETRIKEIEAAVTWSDLKP